MINNTMAITGHMIVAAEKQMCFVKQFCLLAG